MTTTSTTGAARDITSHVRQNDGVLARAEKATLLWLAHRLPRWMHSDHLSALGLFGMVGVAGAFWAGGSLPWMLLLVGPALALNWFGDSLDGTVARVRGEQRPRYGYYLDHVLDIAGTSLLFGGIALGGHMAPALAAALLAAYVAVMAEVFLATAARGVFRMSYLGLGPTELRIILAIGALALLWSGEVWVPGLGATRLFDIGGTVGVAGLTGVFVAGAVRNGRALFIEEPRPVRPVQVPWW
jgi:archaetidylinositol phosphate synthase